MFNLAIGLGFGTNPCIGIERNSEEKQERFLSPEELERLKAALATHPAQTSANAIRLLLLTGAPRKARRSAEREVGSVQPHRSRLDQTRRHNEAEAGAWISRYRPLPGNS